MNSSAIKTGKALVADMSWEEIQQYEEVPGYGQHIWFHESQYYLVQEERTIMSWLNIYKLPTPLFKLIDQGERNLSDVESKLKYGARTGEIPHLEIQKFEWSKRPDLLLYNREKQVLFTEKELGEILPPGATIYNWRD